SRLARAAGACGTARNSRAALCDPPQRAACRASSLVERGSFDPWIQPGLFTVRKDQETSVRIAAGWADVPEFHPFQWFKSFQNVLNGLNSLNVFYSTELPSRLPEYENS